MKYDGLTLKTVVIGNFHTRKNIKDALLELGEVDADFAGHNGDDYLSASARKAHYDSTAEFISDAEINKLQEGFSVEDVKKIIKSYIKRMLNYSGGYFSSSEYTIIEVENTLVVSLALVD